MDEWICNHTSSKVLDEINNQNFIMNVIFIHAVIEVYPY